MYNAFNFQIYRYNQGCGKEDLGMKKCPGFVESQGLEQTQKVPSIDTILSYSAVQIINVIGKINLCNW